jgi:hypothetical protein
MRKLCESYEGNSPRNSHAMRTATYYCK